MSTIVTWQASGECCTLKSYDSMILSDIPSSVEPDSETSSCVTLAVLLKDVTRFYNQGNGGTENLRPTSRYGVVKVQINKI